MSYLRNINRGVKIVSKLHDRLDNLRNNNVPEGQNSIPNEPEENITPIQEPVLEDNEDESLEERPSNRHGFFFKFFDKNKKEKGETNLPEKLLKKKRKIKLIIMAGGTFILCIIIMGTILSSKSHASLDLTGSESSGANSNGTTGGVPYTSDEIESALVYVGDSRTVGMQGALNNSKISFIAEVSMGYNWLVSTASARLDTALQDTTKKFVVMAFGVNDLGNISSYINEYNSLISKYPNVSFYFLSVNPTDPTKYSGAATNIAIESFNAKLKSTYGDKYIDSYSQIKDSFSSPDGLHYDNQTYIKIHNVVIDYIKSKESKGGGAVSFLDDYPLDKEGTTALSESLENVIGKDGVEELNTSISSSVEAAGKCTGNAVAAAAVALVNGLHTKGYRIPYYWGGGHSTYITGANSNWGTYHEKGSCSDTQCYHNEGLDCSGFVSWAMTQAGVPTIRDTNGFLEVGVKKSFSEANPGDIFCNVNHTFLVVDKKDNKVIVAESTGGDVGVVFRAYGESEVTSLSLLDMTNYYSSNCK